MRLQHSPVVWIRTAARTAGLALLLGGTIAWADTTTGAQKSGSSPELLDALAQRCVTYFWKEAHPRTGLVKDRAKNTGTDHTTVASIAATGFGLTGLAIGAERGWLPQDEAKARAARTLRFLLGQMPNRHGWYYHFVDYRTGERVWKCELSSIDTALLVAGALAAGRAFYGTEVTRLAERLYRQVDFRWMLTDGGRKPREKTLCMGWKPETGFLQSRWTSYDELMILYLLGLGSPTHPLPAESWYAWKRPVHTYGAYRGVALDLPLFVHQYSHAFVDFRGLRDRRGFDPWQNSVTATRMNRRFCIDHAAQYRGYGPLSWGLSACDGPDGYRAYAPAQGQHDGTITPWAVAASLPFAPDLCLPALRVMRSQTSLWGRYGFPDAFNRDRDWQDPDVIGIDLGAALLMIENHRSGWVWKRFSAHPSIRRALRRAGLTPGKPSGEPQTSLD
jgi:hypothetical protein